MADPSAPGERRLPARIIAQGEPLVAFTETGDGRLAIRRHVHNNRLLGSALTQTRALGGNGLSLCLLPPFPTSDNLLPSMLWWAARHRGSMTGVVPNCALSSRSIFAIMPVTDQPAG